MNIIYYNGEKTLYLEGSVNMLFDAHDGSRMYEISIPKENDDIICNYMKWDIILKESNTKRIILFKKSDMKKSEIKSDKNYYINIKFEKNNEIIITNEYLSWNRKRKIKNILKKF